MGWYFAENERDELIEEAAEILLLGEPLPLDLIARLAAAGVSVDDVRGGLNTLYHSGRVCFTHSTAHH